jgi:hypothetical protein
MGVGESGTLSRAVSRRVPGQQCGHDGHRRVEVNVLGARLGREEVPEGVRWLGRRRGERRRPRARQHATLDLRVRLPHARVVQRCRGDSGGGERTALRRGGGV